MLRPALYAVGIAYAAAVIKIGCIGDSITAGVCSQTTHGYPAVLQGLLGAGYQVSNFGNSGKTMLKYGGPGDSSYWNQTTWTQAQQANSDIYTILLGTNDAKTFNWFPCTGAPFGYANCSWVGGDNYTADYLEMITILKAQPAKPRVFVMSPPPLYPPNPYSMNKTVINGVLPWLLPQIATGGAGAEPAVIDLFDALGGANLTQPNITCDGCHPVDKGYIEMAQAIYAVLSHLRETEEPGWPSFSADATAEQMLAAEPRPEWNLRHPELFQHRANYDPDLFEKVARPGGGWMERPKKTKKAGGKKKKDAAAGWRIREV